jgi:hypothetical protein
VTGDILGRGDLVVVERVDRTRLGDKQVSEETLLFRSTETFPFRDPHPHVRTLVDAFGRRRTFWGTDLTRMPCTYYECITVFTEHLPWLVGEDLEWVMGRGVREWVGWR